MCRNDRRSSARLYRAIDQHGQVIDVLVTARRFFTRALPNRPCR
jgi:transposase-like protein